MTREDAIVWLNTDDYESAGFQKALEIAIKALEQQDILFKSGLLKDCESCKV